MSDSDSGPKTRGGRREKYQQPSSSHYVGYVDDEESILSIMKKFEELENFKEQIAKNNDDDKENKENENKDEVDIEASPNTEKTKKKEDLTQDQLEEVFKRTSMFSAKSMSGKKPTYTQYGNDIDDEEWREALFMRDNSGDDLGSWSDDEELWDDEFLDFLGKKSKKRSKRALKEMKKRKDKKPREKGSRNQYLIDRSNLQAGGQRAAMKRKEKVVDPRKPTFVRIPEFPISISWCRTIEPLKPKLKELPACTRYKEMNIHDTVASQSFLEKFSGEKFTCILMDPPLTEKEDGEKDKISIKQMEKLKLNKMIDAGFIFMWLEKEFVPAIFKLMTSWEFRYVENICWLKKTVDNKLFEEDSEYLMKSKLTCYIFRKANEFVELRHQRNCDIIVDYVQPQELNKKLQQGYVKEHRPEFLYTIIETLLPDARCGCNMETNTPRVHVGQCLELWSVKNTHRQGWLQVPHVPSSIE